MIEIIQNNQRVPLIRYRDPNRSFGDAITEQGLQDLGFTVYDNANATPPDPGADQRVRHDGYDAQGQDMWVIEDLTQQEIDDRRASRRAAQESSVDGRSLRAFVGKVMPPASELSDEDKTALMGLFDEWDPDGVAYGSGKPLVYQAKLYEVITGHTSQSTWTPTDSPSLFTEITPPGVVGPWRQPTGAHYTYAQGAIVEHNGQQWQSDVPDNVWEPGVYGWSMVAS